MSNRQLPNQGAVLIGDAEEQRTTFEAMAAGIDEESLSERKRFR